MIIEETLKEMELSDEDSDWAEAMGYASFYTNDIIRVIGSACGYNDGDSWIAIFKLTNDRFGWVTAGCCYTGWD